MPTPPISASASACMVIWVVTHSAGASVPQSL